jgi:glycosyltransferase involved in cell wall biosynthesis
MNIVIVLPSLKNEAPIKVALAIIRGVLNKGANVDIICLDDNQIDVSIPSSVNVYKKNDLKTINFKKYDVVHSHLFRADLFVALKPKSVYKKNVVLISTLHNYYLEELENYYNKMYSLFFGFIWNLAWLRFSSLVTLTSDSKAYYQKHSLNKKIVVVNNGHDITVNNALLDGSKVESINLLKSKCKVVIGTYCNLVKRKNIHLLIQYLKHNPSVGLVVFGKGREKEVLIEQSIKLNVQDRFVLFDFDPVAHQYNSTFDFFIIPSVNEGFGLSVIEAALHNTKIICSDTLVFRELYSSLDVGFFDTKDLSTIDPLLELNRKWTSTRERSIEYYSEEVMAKNYWDLYIDSYNKGSYDV